MDGNYSQDDIDEKDLDSDEKSTTNEIHAVDEDSDEDGYYVANEDSSAGEDSSVDHSASADPCIASLAGNTLDHSTIDEAEKQAKLILAGIAKVCQGVQVVTGAAKNLKRKAEEQAECVREAQQMKANSIRAMKRTRAKRHEWEEENLGLRRQLKQDADCVVIKRLNEKLHQQLLEKQEELHKTKAELEKELGEKADYHDISEQRREFHPELIEKTSTCRDLEWKNAQLRRELNETANNCKDLESKVAELQRELDEEASFSAQIKDMVSKKSGK
ncbi:hypothetical protein SLS63_004305 [Diaporthe eres]|uniref:Uncharacterized protein n=1 Tax=Diaporthe eres TaxID=83184 RepID=A0ABR1PEP6_DIAER